MSAALVEIDGRTYDRVRLSTRFWAKVLKGEGCWEWQRATNGSGYGSFGVESGRSKLAHRVAWILERGPVPVGLYVLHDCDNPLRVRPGHLYAGTHADNTRDMVERNRVPRFSRRGAKGHNARLTEEQVDEIKLLLGLVTQRELAIRYGVSQSTISFIKTGTTWSTHSPDPAVPGPLTW